MYYLLTSVNLCYHVIIAGDFQCDTFSIHVFLLWSVEMLVLD